MMICMPACNDTHKRCFLLPRFQILASQMFSREIVGTASATSGGWGNMGGGVCQLVMVLVW
jgi:hypothetical protein